MPNRFVEVMERERAQLIDRMVARIQDVVPQYTQTSTPDLRASVEALAGEMTRLIEGGDRSTLAQNLDQLIASRQYHGITAHDFLKAVAASLQVLREQVRLYKGKDGPNFAADYAQVEAVVSHITELATNIFIERTTRQLAAKNLELNQLNQRLQVQERLLSSEAKSAVTALESAQELNRRIVESLSSGILVVDAATLKVTAFSQRAADILNVPTEQVVGRSALDLAARFQGFDGPAFISMVRTTGRLPMSKVFVQLPDGKKKALYLRGERLINPGGEPEGTVITIEDVTERELLIDSFSRYVSREVLQKVLARGELTLEGERRVCTLLFADVRGFSSLAENCPPDHLHELLNAHLRVLIEAIAEEQGYIDKFVGDNVMAIFVRVADPSEDAMSAVRAAIAIQERIKLANERRVAAGLIPMEVGIGVNTGEVLLGNIGSERKVNFTAIGDSVNVADRLQSIAKAGEILIGEETARLLDGRFPLVDRGVTPLRGRAQGMHVWKLA